MSTSNRRHQRWIAQVDALGDRLLHSFGPFLVRKGVRARAPLVSYDVLMSSIRDSFHMEVLLKSSSSAYEYVKFVSAREMTSTPLPSAKSLKVARAISDRYGLDAPLYLCRKASKKHRPHPWTMDVDLIEEFLSTRVQDDDIEQGEKKGRQPLSHAARMAVWNQWTEGGMYAGSGPCHACSRVISQQEFECGHVIAVANGGKNAIDNLRPLCRACNRSMGTMTLEEFRSVLNGTS